MFQPEDDKNGEEAQGNQQKVDVNGRFMEIQVNSEKTGTGNVGDAARAEGKVAPVLEDKTGNFTESQCDDSQIISAQPKHGKAEQETKKRCHDCPTGKAVQKPMPK